MYCPSVIIAVGSVLLPAGNRDEVNNYNFVSINFDNYLFYKIFIYLDNLYLFVLKMIINPFRGKPSGHTT